MNENKFLPITVLKGLISFILGALYISCLWIIIVYPNSVIALPAMIAFILSSIVLLLLGVALLIS